MCHVLRARRAARGGARRGTMSRMILVVLAAALSFAVAKQPCSSTLPGDYKYTTCGSFCKAEKNVNHCK